jgi:hypothetical protein
VSKRALHRDAPFSLLRCRMAWNAHPPFGRLHETAGLDKRVWTRRRRSVQPGCPKTPAPVFPIPGGGISREEAAGDVGAHDTVAERRPGQSAIRADGPALPRTRGRGTGARTAAPEGRTVVLIGGGP